MNSQKFNPVRDIAHSPIYGGSGGGLRVENAAKAGLKIIGGRAALMGNLLDQLHGLEHTRQGKGSIFNGVGHNVGIESVFEKDGMRVGIPTLLGCVVAVDSMIAPPRHSSPA